MIENPTTPEEEKLVQSPFNTENDTIVTGKQIGRAHV